MATLANIKTQIGQTELTLVRQLDENKQPTQWLSHWDDKNRVRVSLHQDVLSSIKANPTFDGLGYKKEVVPAKMVKGADGKETEQAPYTRIVLITPKNIEAVL